MYKGWFCNVQVYTFTLYIYSIHLLYTFTHKCRDQVVVFFKISFIQDFCLCCWLQELIYSNTRLKYSVHADLILPALLSALNTDIDIDSDLCLPRKHCRKKVKSLQLLSGRLIRKKSNKFHVVSLEIKIQCFLATFNSYNWTSVICIMKFKLF